MPLIKKGLSMIGTALYTTVCALTLAHGQVSEVPKKEEVKQYSLEEICSVRQEYENLLKSVVRDGVIGIEDIKKLNEYLSQHMPHIPYTREDLSSTLKEPISLLQEDIKKSYEIKFKIEREIFINYPGFTGDAKFKVFYSANEKLEGKDSTYLNALVKQAQNFIPNGNSTLEKLKDKTEYTFKDLITFFSFIKEVSEKSEKKDLDLNVESLYKHKKIYEKAIERYNKFKQEADKKYFSGSVGLYMWYYCSATEDCVCHTIVNDAEDRKFLLKEICMLYPSVNSMSDIRFEKIEDTMPFETKWPMWLWMPLSFLGAGLLKLGITRYTKRGLDWRDGVYDFFVNPAVGFLFLDWLNPWIMPIRVIAGPIITEKLYSMSDKKHELIRRYHHRRDSDY